MRRLKRSLRKDEAGVASTVGTIMALLVFLTFLSLIVNQYVPVWMKDSESAHMSGALGQFGGLKGSLDLQVLAAQIAQDAGSHYIPVTASSPVTLGIDGVPIFSAPTLGEMALNPDAGAWTVEFYYDIRGVETFVAEASSGAVSLAVQNRYYIPQRVVYENGAVIRWQTDGQVIRAPPVFEPVRDRIAGAVRDLTDSSGDARLFTENLARVCREKLGVRIQLGTRVTALPAAGDRVLGAVTDRGVQTADAYVLALGVHSPIVARSAGVKLAIYPAKGYSSTFPLKAGGLAPTLPGVDERWLVGWSRLGDRLRLTSTAEFAGYDWGWTPRDFNNILRLARDLFPDAADYDQGQYRACLRPMTPDGPPILGLGRHRNLFLNCGHGHMGWTMACGTARLVADLMTGRMPELDLEGLTLRR